MQNTEKHWKEGKNFAKLVANCPQYADTHKQLYVSTQKYLL